MRRKIILSKTTILLQPHSCTENAKMPWTLLCQYTSYRTMTHAEGTEFICKTQVPRAIREPLSIQSIHMGLTDMILDLWMIHTFLAWLLEVTWAAVGYLKQHCMSTFRHLNDAEVVWNDWTSSSTNTFHYTYSCFRTWNNSVQLPEMCLYSWSTMLQR